MAERRIYFGTRERMTWVRSPNSGMGRNRVGWSANGTYLNGGGWSRRSETSHFEPSLTWSFLNHIEIREIMDYYHGAYGPGPYFWLDPFSMATNVLPVHWSIPRLAAEDAPPLVRPRRPSLSDTPGNTIGLPSKMATYELRSSDNPSLDYDQLFIPVPEGFAIHVAAWGSSTGTARLHLDNLYDIDLTSPTLSNPTWTTVVDMWPGTVMSVRGEGTLTLAGLVVQVLPDPDFEVIPGLMTSLDLPTSPSLVTSTTQYVMTSNIPGVPRFLSGEGHSGVDFKSAPTVVGYSAPQAIDYQSLTAEFIEVGSWRR